MTGVVADRLYLGDVKIFDASEGGAPVVSADVFDQFDRSVLGSDYVAYNLLNQGSAVGIGISARGIMFTSGYTATAIRDYGHSDGLLSTHGASGNNYVQLIFRFQDVNNWLSWFPGGGRFRVRQGGVSYDTTVATTSGTDALHEVVMDGSTISFYSDGSLIGTVTESRFLTATKHGVGNANSAGAQNFRTLGYQEHPVPDWDVAAISAALDAATTFDGLTAATEDLFGFYGFVPNYHPTPSATPGSSYTGSMTATDPALKQALKATVRAVARLPILYRGNNSPTQVHYGRGLAAGSGVTSAGVISLAIEPTAMQLETVSSEVDVSLEFVFLHELGHVLYQHTMTMGSTSALTAAFNASNPPGFTYGGTAVGGPRPAGFCRAYGTQAIAEDVADVFGWLMTMALRPQLLGWTSTDTYLAGKVNGMKTFLSAFGWPPRYYT